MKSIELQPDRDLADFIQLIWVLESEHDDDVYPRELIMPDGIVEIVFHYRDPFYTWQEARRYTRDGPRRSPIGQRCGIGAGGARFSRNRRDSTSRVSRPTPDTSPR
jgi:hypothetical protein